MNTLKIPDMVGVIALIVPVVMFLAGCNKDSAGGPDSVQIELTNLSDCKTTYFGKMSLETPSDQDCLEYQLDGDGVLRVHHVNAGFNCCPEIQPDIEVTGNVITIDEVETLAQCQCLCLFDLDYEVSGINPGAYVIRVSEPYLNEGDQPLEFEVNLADEPSGSYCVGRDHYPWNMPE